MADIAFIAAAATGNGVLVVQHQPNIGEVAIFDVNREDGPSLWVPVTALPDVIEMLEKAMRALEKGRADVA